MHAVRAFPELINTLLMAGTAAFAGGYTALGRSPADGLETNANVAAIGIASCTVILRATDLTGGAGRDADEALPAFHACEIPALRAVCDFLHRLTVRKTLPCAGVAKAVTGAIESALVAVGATHAAFPSAAKTTAAIVIP